MPDVAFAVAEPAARGHLLLREELHAFAALHVQVAEERFVPAVKGKPRHRGRHTDIDADHAGLGAMLEFARRLAAAGKDGRAVAIHGFVGQLDGLAQIFHVHHVQHRAENFFLGDRGAALDVVKNRCANIKSIRRLGNFDTATIGQNFRALLLADGN